MAKLVMMALICGKINRGVVLLFWSEVKGKKEKEEKKGRKEGRKEGEDGAAVSYNSLKFFNELVDEILRWKISSVNLMANDDVSS